MVFSNKTFLLVCAIISIFACAVAPDNKQQTATMTTTTVAVLPSDGAALGNEELEALTDKIRMAALKVLPTNAFALMKHDVIVKRLGGAEAYIKECSESSCIVDLGKKAQVDYVAQATVSKLGDKIRVKVELYNVFNGGLIGICDGEAENIGGLFDIVEKRVSAEVFSQIPGALRSSITTVSASSASSVQGGNVLTDNRDGKKYKTVKIGNQIWMAENLNYNAKDSKCYDDEESNCKKYGRLYDWATAIALPIWCNSVKCASKIGAKHKGICPSGWHLPSFDEWDVLEEAIGGMKMGGKHLKAKSGWNSDGNGLDTYGFAALPGGASTWWDGKFRFEHIGDFGNWWTSTEDAANYALRHYMEHKYVNLYYSYYTKSVLFSVRCIQD